MFASRGGGSAILDQHNCKIIDFFNNCLQISELSNTFAIELLNILHVLSKWLLQLFFKSLKIFYWFIRQIFSLSPHTVYAIAAINILLHYVYIFSHFVWDHFCISTTSSAEHYCTTIPLHHYCTAPFHRNTTALHYYTTALYTTVQLHDYTTTLLHNYSITLLHNYSTTLLHHFIATPLHYTTTQLHYTLLYNYTTTPLHYCTTTPLHYCTTTQHQSTQVWVR